MPDNVPFVQLNLVVSELHLTSVSDLVDCLLIVVGEVEHIIGGIPTSMDIMQYHVCIEKEVI